MNDNGLKQDCINILNVTIYLRNFWNSKAKGKVSEKIRTYVNSLLIIITKNSKIFCTHNIYVKTADC